MEPVTALAAGADNSSPERAPDVAAGATRLLPQPWVSVRAGRTGTHAPAAPHLARSRGEDAALLRPRAP